MPLPTCGQGYSKGIEINKGGICLREARKNKCEKRKVEIHGYALGRKGDAHCRLWFENFDGVPVKSCHLDRINCTRKVGRQIGADRIGKC